MKNSQFNFLCAIIISASAGTDANQRMIGGLFFIIWAFYSILEWKERRDRKRVETETNEETGIAV